MVYEFDVEKETASIVSWIKAWFVRNHTHTAIVGISGGVDSSTVAALCVKALGKDNVIGVLMPNGDQKDIDFSYKLTECLQIQSATVNIEAAYKALTKEINLVFSKATEQYETNTPARIRMTTLYGISAITGGMVANTCNMSETFCGYDTLYGDSAGSFAPIARYTKTEVRAIAKYLGLPEELYNKVSIDGMSLNEDGSYKADEDKLGFTYSELDNVIREDIQGPNYDKIINIFKTTAWKRKIINIDHYEPSLSNPNRYLW